MTTDAEAIHTIRDFHDVPRSGIADRHGAPHVYECQFDDAGDDWSNRYWLMPIDAETFRWELERFALGERLVGAYLARDITDEQFMAAHRAGPCLPEDRPRFEELRRLIGGKLAIDPARAERVIGEFERITDEPWTAAGGWRVRWRPGSA